MAPLLDSAVSELLAAVEAHDMPTAKKIHTKCLDQILSLTPEFPGALDVVYASAILLDCDSPTGMGSERQS